jgi:hypothetical protein
MAEPTGLEPATSDVTGRRSNQLNYDSARTLPIFDCRLPIELTLKRYSNRQLEIGNRQCIWWARRDSNPQPLPCKGSRLPLTYVPVFKNQMELTASRRSVIVRKTVEQCQGSLWRVAWFSISSACSAKSSAPAAVILNVCHEPQRTRPRAPAEKGTEELKSGDYP